MAEQKPLHMVLQVMDAPAQEITDMPTTLEAFHSEKMRTMNEKLGQIDELEAKIEAKKKQIDTYAGSPHRISNGLNGIVFTLTIVQAN